MKPSFVQIEPVGQCNLRCQMCPIIFRKDGPPHGPLAFMDFDLFTRIVDEMSRGSEVHLQGLGEPTMHPRFFEMVRYAVDRGMIVSTNSNLTLLRRAKAEDCIASGLEWLHISIDGATPETYEAIRKRARLDRVLENLENLLASRSLMGSITPHLRLVAVVMRMNLHELPALVRLAHQWEMEEFFVQHLAHDFQESTLPVHYEPMREFVDQQTLLHEDPARIDHYFEEAKRVAVEVGLKLRLPRTRRRVHPGGTPGRTRCDWPWRGMYLSYQGLAMPCCMVATPDRANFGRVGKGGIHEVWNSSAYEEFRKKLDSDDPPEICRSCSLYHGVF
jgi:radical SAM protein with 4Fe4S-binding SPASM domain